MLPKRPTFTSRYNLLAGPAARLEESLHIGLQLLYIECPLPATGGATTHPKGVDPWPSKIQTTYAWLRSHGSSLGWKERSEGGKGKE